MKSITLIATAVLAAVALASCQGAVTDAANAAIQEAMNAYIQAKLAASNDTYDIKGVAATFDYLHDGVMEVEGSYVSCADFKHGEDVYDIDFYVKEENGTYSVVKVVLHKKNKEAVDEAM